MAKTPEAEKHAPQLLDRGGPRPLYVQFEEIVREKISTGEWPLDSRIPSENELSAAYHLSRMTVRSVLNRIVDDGLLRRVQGRGTFVAEPKIDARPLSQMGIREQLEHMGLETATRLLEVVEEPAAAAMAEKLAVQPGTPLYRVRRLRLVKGRPFSVHTSFIPTLVCPGLENQDLTGMQLCDIQEKIYRQEIVRRVETLESVPAGSQEAALLHIAPSAPLLLFENLVYIRGGKPIECARVLFRADKIKLRLEYEK